VKYFLVLSLIKKVSSTRQIEQKAFFPLPEQSEVKLESGFRQRVASRSSMKINLQIVKNTFFL
jgi:hypothetical protein